MGDYRRSARFSHGKLLRETPKEPAEIITLKVTDENDTEIIYWTAKVVPEEFPEIDISKVPFKGARRFVGPQRFDKAVKRAVTANRIALAQRRKGFAVHKRTKVLKVAETSERSPTPR